MQLALDFLECSAVDLKYVETDKLGIDVKLWNLEKDIILDTFEAFRFMALERSLEIFILSI